MYQSCYDLIMQYVFNGATVTPHIELVATTLSTIGAISVVALPFIVVFKVLKLILGA